MGEVHFPHPQRDSGSHRILKVLAPDLPPRNQENHDLRRALQRNSFLCSYPLPASAPGEAKPRQHADADEGHVLPARPRWLRSLPAAFSPQPSRVLGSLAHIFLGGLVRDTKSNVSYGGFLNGSFPCGGLTADSFLLDWTGGLGYKKPPRLLPPSPPQFGFMWTAEPPIQTTQGEADFADKCWGFMSHLSGSNS